MDGGAPSGDDDASRESAGVEAEALAAALSPEHMSIDARAHDYGHKVHAWLHARAFLGAADPCDPRAVLDWFHYVIPSKIHRALHGIAEDDPHVRDWPADLVA